MTFKEYRLYEASQVDNELTILTQSRDFWKKKCEELQKENDRLNDDRK